MMDLTKLPVTNTAELASELESGGGLSYRAEKVGDKIIWKSHLRKPNGDLCRVLKSFGGLDDRQFLSANALYAFHARFFGKTTALHLPMQMGLWGDYHYLDGSHRPFEGN